MRIKSRKTYAVIGTGAVALAIVGGVAGCNSNSNSESSQQNTDSTNLENNQPLPYVTWSQARENLIDIELAQVNNVQTTTFVTHNGDPDPISSCPSIGFGIPDSASLSNPLKPASNSGSWADDVVGQEDPTGYYAPVSSAGTFTICLAADGTPYISRVEDNVDTVGGPATWDKTTHSYSLTGAPTAIAKAGSPSQANATKAAPVKSK
jgi:hypothetical protein